MTAKQADIDPAAIMAWHGQSHWCSSEYWQQPTHAGQHCEPYRLAECALKAEREEQRMREELTEASRRADRERDNAIKAERERNEARAEAERLTTEVESLAAELGSAWQEREEARDLWRGWRTNSRSWRSRAEKAEQEAERLAGKVARVEAKADDWSRSPGMGANAAARVLRVALADQPEQVQP